MQLTYVAVVVLASMIFVLSGMVGYVYWQQTRMLQNLQSLAVVISTHFVRPSHPAPESGLPETVPETAPVTGLETVAETDEDEMPALIPAETVPLKEDDRVSVPEGDVEVVEGPDYEKKTAAELRDILTAKGIPFGKRDAKTVLVQLIKATA
jgi:hypothetical protein